MRWYFRSDFLVTDHDLHLLDGGVGVDVLVVGQLVVLQLLLAPLTPPGQLPVDQTEAVHVRSLPTVEDVLVDGLVQQFRRHVALGADLVVEWDVHLPVISQSTNRQS